MKAKIILSLVIDTSSPDLPEPPELLLHVKKVIESIPFIMCVGADMYNLSTNNFVGGIGEPWVDQIVLTESLKQDQETLG